jgi:hypothetical protein
VGLRFVRESDRRRFLSLNPRRRGRRRVAKEPGRQLEEAVAWGASAPAKTGEVSWMKEPHGEEVATHTDPEPCAVVREGGGEALEGARAGRVWSRENQRLRDADAIGSGGRQHRSRRYREVGMNPARSESPSTHGSISHGSREVPRLSAVGEGKAVRTGKSEDTRR